MENLKRSQVNTISDHDNIKRKKLNVTTDGYITTFEDLSNETVYEVFEYLDLHSSFEAFYDLNQRFQNLFIYINLTIKINISSISKSNFHRYLTHVIEPYSARIQLLRISTPFATDMTLLLLPILKNINRLETLIINNIESKYIVQIIDRLPNLPVLSSLIAVSIDDDQISNEVYQKIFRLPALKYCQMGIEAKSSIYPLPFAIEEFSSIEHLVINNEIGFQRFSRLLSYVPKLRRLSLNNLNGFGSSWSQIRLIQLNDITHVSLKLNAIRFQDFELMVTSFFRQTSRLVIHCKSSTTDDMEYINADGWERLISTHMPNLRIFDCQIELSSWYCSVDHQVCDALVCNFNSIFWTTHQWYFEHYYYVTSWTKSLIFFSINPYRRKKYMLYEKSKDNINFQCIHTNMNSIQDLYIHTTNAMKQCVDNFPNTTELTLTKNFDISRDSTVTDLNRIVSLRQLTKLTLDYYGFGFEYLIKLLTFTPNLNTLKLDAVLIYRADSTSIQQNDLFKLVSRMNTISNLTINQEMNLEQIQFVTALFPRLQSLTTNIYQANLESITRFLLSKSNNNTRYLSTLCIIQPCPIFSDKLQFLIQSENLLEDYTLKVINETLYLWW